MKAGHLIGSVFQNKLHLIHMSLNTQSAMFYRVSLSAEISSHVANLCGSPHPDSSSTSAGDLSEPHIDRVSFFEVAGEPGALLEVRLTFGSLILRSTAFLRKSV